jgi:hypothetical protein
MESLIVGKKQIQRHLIFSFVPCLLNSKASVNLGGHTDLRKT